MLAIFPPTLSWRKKKSLITPISYSNHPLHNVKGRRGRLRNRMVRWIILQRFPYLFYISHRHFRVYSGWTRFSRKAEQGKLEILFFVRLEKWFGLGVILLKSWYEKRLWFLKSCVTCTNYFSEFDVYYSE